MVKVTAQVIGQSLAARCLTQSDVGIRVTKWTLLTELTNTPTLTDRAAAILERHLLGNGVPTLVVRVAVAASHGNAGFVVWTELKSKIAHTEIANFSVDTAPILAHIWNILTLVNIFTGVGAGVPGLSFLALAAVGSDCVDTGPSHTQTRDGLALIHILACLVFDVGQVAPPAGMGRVGALFTRAPPCFANRSTAQ